MKKALSIICLVILVYAGQGIADAFAAVDDSTHRFITDPVFMCGSGSKGQARVKLHIFESVPTHPLAVSDDGTLLFAINAPANCLEIFEISGSELTLRSTVSVGIDPVSVAQRTQTEIWVVNHISDSISIVDIAGRPRIIETLQVGDAPWDVVFADNGRGRIDRQHNRRNRAFVSASFRGQHHPQFSTKLLLKNRLDVENGKRGELIGRADLWAFDIDQNTNDKSLAGIINLFTDTIRSLAVNQDGSRVYATAFKSGNRTTITPVPFDALIGEKWSTDGVGMPEPILIVQQNDQKHWLDLLGRDWSSTLNFSIADNDFFVINAASDLKLGNQSRPVFNRQAIESTVKDLGSILFNSVYDPVHNRIIISGLESNNLQPMVDKLQGKFVSNQLVIVDFGKSDTPEVRKMSLDSEEFALPGVTRGMALPGALHVNAANGALLLASLGGNKLSQFKLSTKDGSYKVSDLTQQYLGKTSEGAGITAGGPIGFATDKRDRLLIVYTLFDNKLLLFKSTPTSLSKLSEYALFNPEAPRIRYGRQYLYDATLTSSNGAVSCASCHIFGGSDKLQWDLSEKDKPVEIVELGYVSHPDRDIPDLKTSVRAIPFRQNPEEVKVGDKLPLGDLKVPIVFMGSKKLFADALEGNQINLQSPGLAYLEAGAPDARLSQYRRISKQATWLLIDTPFFHPLKGPMRTLPLYGIAHSGALHFRGDFQGLYPHDDNHCPKGETVEERSLKEFNTPCDGSPGTFEALFGGKALSEDAMDALSQYIFSLSYPPNPIRPLNNQANSEGEKIFKTQKMGVDVTDFKKILAKGPLIFRCIDCHTLDRSTHSYGTSGLLYSAPALTLQDAKIPHLRFLYNRIGFFRGDYRDAGAWIKPQGWQEKLKRTLYEYFGFFKADFASSGRYLTPRPLEYYDEMIHGLGFNHGGRFDTTMFTTSAVWILNSQDPNRVKAETLARYENLFEYLMAFDTEYFPMFGQQFTFRATDLQAIKSRTASGAALLEEFRDFVDSIFSPVEYSGSQCELAYADATSVGFVKTFVVKNAGEIDTSNNEALAKSLLLLTPKLEPITFTCS